MNQVKVNNSENKLFINGELIEDIEIWLVGKPEEEKVLEITSNFSNSSKKLASLTFNDYPKLSHIVFGNFLDWTRFDNYVSFSTFLYDNRSQLYSVTLEMGITPDLLKWGFAFSFNDYYAVFSNIWNKENFLHGKLFKLNEDSIGIDVGFEIKDFELSIKEIIYPYENYLKYCHEEAIKILSETGGKDKFIASFNFPEILKNSCEQYLIYFAQFLQDLGINVTSDFKEEAGKVLFSVTPTDDIEALDKIREALAIYLSLPSNPIPNSTGDRTVDMVLSGARANAKHLESQLELAIAKLQFKDATLELKDATIEQQQLSLRQKDETIKDLQEIVSRGNIFEESLERIEIDGEVVDVNSLYRFSREDDIEVEATPILEEESEETKIGLVKFHEVTKLKEYGVSFDLAKAIRDLIDYFKREK